MFSFSLVPFDTRKGGWGGMDYLLLQLCSLPKKIGHFESHLKDFKKCYGLTGTPKPQSNSAGNFMPLAQGRLSPPAKGKLLLL